MTRRIDTLRDRHLLQGRFKKEIKLSIFLNKLNSDGQSKPLLLCRYANDCFAIFRSSNHVRSFQDYRNSQQKNITFSSELESNSILPFLDILIDPTNSFSISVYRKPLLTSLFTNFGSFIT